MKLNGKSIHNLKVIVKDYVVDKSYGVCILADCFAPSNYLDMDIVEFQYLYDAICNMKELIEEERINEIRNNTRINQSGDEDTCNT